MNNFTTVFRNYEASDIETPSDALKDAFNHCREKWETSELLFPIGRCQADYYGVRFRIERFSDRRYEWFLSDGIRFRKCSKKTVLAAMEAKNNA